jgi:predicted outer membrane repeat protein
MWSSRGRRPGAWRRTATGLAVPAMVAGFCAMSGAVLPAQAAGAATWTVTDCSGSASDTGSLPYAVAEATAGDTITFSSTLGCSTIALASPVTISTSLTITGPGASELAVSGDNSSRVFVVNNGVTATISGLTVEGGSSTAGGGGIYSQGTLILNNSTVTGNLARGSQGGGIYNAGGTLTLTNSTVSSNQATTSNGYGGGIYSTGGAVSLTGSTVSGNSSSAGYGGGIYGLNASVSLANSTVSGNSTDHAGGGIDGSGGSLMLTNSTVSGNTVSANGGGIYTTGPFTISASTVSGNTAAGAGGGIYNGQSSTGTSTITDSTVTGNGATGTNFGAGLYSLAGTLDVTSSTVTGNIGTHGPGGIDAFAGTVNVAGTILASNAGGNCVGTAVDDRGYNIADDGTCAFSATGSTNGSASLDASLGTLADNGGPTQTILPSASSPAVGQIPVGTTLDGVQACPGTDQRGYSRPGSGETDCTIGAVEYNAQPPVSTPEVPAVPLLALAALGLLGGAVWFRRRRAA